MVVGVFLLFTFEMRVTLIIETIAILNRVLQVYL